MCPTFADGIHCKSLDHVLNSVRDEKLRNLDKHTINDLSINLHILTLEIKDIGERCVDLWGGPPNKE